MNTTTDQGATMIPLDTNSRAGRMLEAGRVTVTFRSPTGEHITLTAKSRKPNDEGRWVGCPVAEAKIIFIEVPNQEGWNDKVGKITRRAGFVADANADPARAWCAKQLLRFVAGQPLASGLEAYEESTCGRCGRALTDPVSIERGIGPECYGQMTGSKHETKKQPSIDIEVATVLANGTAVNAEGDVLGMSFASADAEADYDGTTEYARRESASNGMDKKGVHYGVGDWRARQRVLQDHLSQDAPAERETPAYCHQLSELPGETWEDIFRDAAEAKGITLP